MVFQKQTSGPNEQSEKLSWIGMGPPVGCHERLSQSKLPIEEKSEGEPDGVVDVEAHWRGANMRRLVTQTYTTHLVAFFVSPNSSMMSIGVMRTRRYSEDRPMRLLKRLGNQLPRGRDAYRVRKGITTKLRTPT